MKPTISVVVPVYNVEKYLDRCVESILAQSFSDFELILVDDGSPDRCPVMCDEWAQKDSRISVIHKSNGGLPDARNAGIAKAEGKYMAFVDSDDWVEKDFLQTLYTGIVEHNADVVQCNFQHVHTDTLIPSGYKAEILDETYIKDVLLPGMANAQLENMSYSRWNKFYISEKVKAAVALCDTQISMGEDYLLNFAVFGYCQKIVVLDTVPLYNYFYNTASICGQYNPQHKYIKELFWENVKSIAKVHNCCMEDFDTIRNHRLGLYIYECAISQWDRKSKKREIKEILRMLNKKCWYPIIRTYETPAIRICSLLAYYKMVGPMLYLVDLVKKIKRLP